MNGDLGRLFILLGAVLLLVGRMLLFADRIPWLGRLPGDIVLRRKGFTLYVPIATSILLSLLLTLVFYVLRRR